MKKITFSTVLLLLLLSSNIFPQKTSTALTKSVASEARCSTMETLEGRIANDPEYAAFHNAALAIPSIAHKSAPIPCDGTNTIRVPVAFHFDEGFGCGDADCVIVEVLDQLDALNVGFGDNTGTPQEAVCPAAYQDANGNSVASTGTCIEFYMAEPPAATGLEPCDLPITVGQFNGGLGGGGNGAGAAWAGILNIFITNDQCLGVADGIPGDANGDGVTVCQQTFGGTGGSSAACNLDTDNTFGLGGTLIHEIGHYLGLFHSFQGGCGTQESNPPGPFDVLDTPSHSTPTSGTPTGCSNSDCGGFVPTANFMDYTNDAGYSMFTQDQAQVMNYWANQLFGSNTLADADPNGGINSACGSSCVVICPTNVQTAYSGTEDLCASLGTYDLPSDFSSVVLDESSFATFIWSTGAYISAGGTAVSSSVFTLPNPTTCAPITETLYLNTGCTDNSIQEIDAGTLVLTIYPDPTQFATADLVTFADGACDGPTFTVTPDCTSFVTVTQNGGPSFPVTSGAGPVDYDVTLDYPVECCCPTTVGSETQSNTTSVAIPDNGGTGNQGCTTVTINSGDLITGATADVDITHTWVGDLGITLTSPAGTVITLSNTSGCSGNDLSVTFDDAAANTAADFGNTCNNAPAISGAYQPINPLSSLAGESAAGTWTLCVSDNAGFDTGSITNFGLTLSTEVACTAPVDCAFIGTANYDCSTACASVGLNILFDRFPGQTSWEIMDDATGAVAASSGGTYSGSAANSTITESTCLFDGCYTLNFNDALGNGMCPFRSTASSLGTFITPGTLILPGSIVATLGTVVSPGLCGNFTLSDASGNTLVSGGGAFGSLSSQQFCLTNGVASLWQEGGDSRYMRQSQSEGLNVFPTLAKDNLSISYSFETTEPIQLNIVDINGQIIQQYTQSTSEMQVNVSDISAGIYFVQIVTNGTVLVEKFVKQ